MKEIVDMIKNCEEKSLDEVEDVKIKCQKQLEEEKIKNEKLIQDRKTKNMNLYKKEIEKFKMQLENKKKDFQNAIEVECLQYEKKFEDNNKLAVCAIIDEILNHAQIWKDFN